MARTDGSWSGSWLPGSPGASDHPEQQPDHYPGERLGLPATGPGSQARFGRRAVALLLDWLIGYGLAAWAMTLGLISMPMLSTAVLVVWFLLGAVSVRLFGFTPGQYAVGLRVMSTDHRIHVGFGRALLRGLLIALVFPPLITDADLRGLHDRATATAVVRR